MLRHGICLNHMRHEWRKKCHSRADRRVDNRFNRNGLLVEFFRSHLDTAAFNGILACWNCNKQETQFIFQGDFTNSISNTLSKIVPDNPHKI